MSKNFTFISKEKTQENQESMKQYGQASAYYGLIVAGFIVAGIILSYFGI